MIEKRNTWILKLSQTADIGIIYFWRNKEF